MGTGLIQSTEELDLKRRAWEHGHGVKEVGGLGSWSGLGIKVV